MNRLSATERSVAKAGSCVTSAMPRLRARAGLEAGSAAAEVLREQAEETDAGQQAVDEFSKSLRSLDGKWYVLHTYSGYEKRVKTNIESRVASFGMEDQIFQVEVPMEEVEKHTEKGKKVITRVRVPGYVLIRMWPDENARRIVRETEGVTGFVGPTKDPAPLSRKEVVAMMAPMIASEALKAAGDKPAAAKKPAAPKAAATKTTAPKAAAKAASGRIVQVIGAVVDVEFDGARQHRRRIDPGRQFGPQEHAAARRVPAHAFGHVPRQGGQHRLTLVAVKLADRRNMRIQETVLHHVVDALADLERHLDDLDAHVDGGADHRADDAAGQAQGGNRKHACAGYLDETLHVFCTTMLGNLWLMSLARSATVIATLRAMPL